MCFFLPLLNSIYTSDNSKGKSPSWAVYKTYSVRNKTKSAISFGFAIVITVSHLSQSPFFYYHKIPQLHSTWACRQQWSITWHDEMMVFGGMKYLPPTPAAWPWSCASWRCKHFPRPKIGLFLVRSTFNNQNLAWGLGLK